MSEERVYTQEEIDAIVYGEKFFPDGTVDELSLHPVTIRTKITELGGKIPSSTDVDQAVYTAKQRAAKILFEEDDRIQNERLSNLNEEFELPPGAYMLGDPCYFVADKQWSTACRNIGNRDSAMFELPSEEKYWKTKDTGTVLMLSTIHGDGTYSGSNGFGYGVDAGLLGAVDVVCVNKQSVADSMKLGTYFESEKPIKVTYNRKEISFFREDGEPVIITINA